MATSQTKADPLLRHLEVPLLCDPDISSYRDVPFDTIPNNFGFEKDLQQQDPSSDTLTIAGNLQSWLFFGFLSRVSSAFTVPLSTLDFVTELQGPHACITGSKWPTYCWLWHAAFHCELAGPSTSCCLQLKALLDVINEFTNAYVGADDISTSLELCAVHLSIVVVADYVAHLFEYCTNFAQDYEPHLKTYHWRYPKYGRQLLLTAGWCEQELPVLEERCGPAVLLFLSSLDRLRPEKDHTRCQHANMCVTNQLDLQTYRTRHTHDCRDPNCRVISSPITSVSAILAAGGIPVIRLETPADSCEAALLCEAFDPSNSESEVEYIAISHVWSDGMGNPGRNELWACQVNRIQHAVNKLRHPKSDASVNMLFWMDTLCVPLDPKMRSMAITLMAKTYFHAAKVLVMDSWLMNHFRDVSFENMLVAVALSDWSSRLWTFQEIILANQCSFLFGDNVVDIDSLDSRPPQGRNIPQVSDILSKWTVSGIAESPAATKLLRALCDFDLEIVYRTRRDAALPPQEDEHMEMMRVTSIAKLDYNELEEKIVEKWIPLLFDEAFAREESLTDLDQVLRINIEAANFDPVRHFGTTSLYRFRSLSYMDASFSPFSNGPSQRNADDFFGNQAVTSPAILLIDIAVGLPRRMTSRLEDETICVGGMIGLDVSPILRFKAASRDPAEVESVCIERMKVLLSLIRKFHPSIIFWTSNRLAQYPWRWAPSSFLDKGSCKAMHTPYPLGLAEVTSRGLLYQYEGIRISLKQSSDIAAEIQVLTLEYIDSALIRKRTKTNQYPITWLHVELCRSNATPCEELTWEKLSASETMELALILFGESGLEAVLVRILDIDDSTTYTEYISNVKRVPAGRHCANGNITVQAKWLSTRRFCVG